MSTSLYDLPDMRQAEMTASERKTEAKRHFEAIVKSGEQESICSLRIGWHAHILKRENLFGLLGFESEDDARKASGIGRSTWYDTIRLAEAFDGIKEEQFTSMKLANAKALSDLPESKRLSREWIRMAGSMPVEKFQAKVDEEMNGKAKPSDGRESTSTLKVSMSSSQKKVVEECLKEYGAAVGVDGDLSKALELMVVEHTGSTTLIGSITNAVQRIKNAKSLASSGLSADEALTKILDELDSMLLEFSQALASAQNGHSDKQQ